MNTWTSALPYFPAHELACKCGCGTVLLDVQFAAALPFLRTSWGSPLTPTSVCRCPPHNAREGGHRHSLHMTKNPVHPSAGTLAADLYWEAWPTDRKLRFARLARRLGWSVGLHDTFCHVDRRGAVGLPQAVFVYGTWSGAFSPSDVAEIDHGKP